MRSGGGTPSPGSPDVPARDRWQRRFDERWAEYDHRFARDAWRGGRGARLWIPVVISLVVQMPFAVWVLARPGQFSTDRVTGLLGLALALLGPVALIAARRFPGPVVAIVVAGASADLLLTTDPSGPPYVAVAFAILSAVVRGARVWAWVSIAIAWIATIAVGAVLDVERSPVAIAAITLGVVVVLGVGESIRTRRERFEQADRAALSRRQTAVEAERVRIARELHDVLAHSLSQINVQAAVGLHLADTQPDRAAEALANIKESSKIALDEVRSVLGVLRSGETSEAALVPEPDLSRVPALIASVRSSSGIVVSFDDGVTSASDAARLPTALQSAVYRIVQESLTNVVRHSGASTALVSLRYADRMLEVSISDDGSGGSTAGAGRGVLGMRERAELLGGRLDIDAAGTDSMGTDPTGIDSTGIDSTGTGFAVRATLPVRRDEATT